MSDSPLSLGGLASGLDTNGIVDKLMALERRPQTRLKAKQAESQSRQDALRDVRTRLSNLKGALEDLRSTGLWADTQSVDVGDPTRVAVTRTGATGPGGYELKVIQLASAEQRTFDYLPPAADSTISIGAASVPVGAGASLDDLVAAINSSTLPAYAAAVGGRLVLSARATGSAGTFSASGGSLTERTDLHLAARDAQFEIDGRSGSSSSNTVADAIPGLQIKLKGTTGGGTVSILVGPPSVDTEKVKAKLKAFVEQYNSTTSFMRSKAGETRARSADGATTKGFLSGDSLLEGMLSKLRVAVSAGYGSGTVDRLADLGISTGAAVGSGGLNHDSIDGKLVLDEDKLDAALAADPQAVRSMLGGKVGVSGFAQALSAAVDSAASTGGTLDTRIASEDSNKRSLSAQADALDVRLKQREAMLKRQFAAMEQAMQSSQSQQQWLAGQLAGLQRSR